MSVSNPKSKYVVYLSVLSRISNCQGLGCKNNNETLKTDRNGYLVLQGNTHFRTARSKQLLELLARKGPGTCWGGVLLTEILLPRIARRGTVCLISTRGQARKARIEKFELDEGFQPYHHPFQVCVRLRSVFKISCLLLRPRLWQFNI